MKQNSFLGGIFLLICVFIYFIYEPFLLNIAIASLLVTATIPAHIALKKRLHSKMATTVLTVFLAFLFFAPVTYFLVRFSSLITLIDPTEIYLALTYLKGLLVNLPVAYKDEIAAFLNSIDLAELSKNTLSLLGGAGLKSAVFLKDIAFVLVFFFFLHIYGTPIAKFFIEAIPYNNYAIKTSLLNMISTMSVVSYSIVITALFEGILFGLVVWFYGYDFFLFCILYGFASMIPVVGGFIMWFPIALFEASKGNYQGAIVIISYSIFVISIVADTFVRPVIIDYINKKFNKTNTKVHSMLIFFSIIAGISSFGFWGAILGPGVTALFIGIMNLFRQENKGTAGA